ncbi:MAG: hypothetical protein IPK52_20540 [Chloroflexi bacterium]|nr:hypothetical protein [Chloroflexota bacterium]
MPSRDKVRDFAVGLLPDFRRGGMIVRLPVGRIIVLVGIVLARWDGRLTQRGRHELPRPSLSIGSVSTSSAPYARKWRYVQGWRFPAHRAWREKAPGGAKHRVRDTRIAARAVQQDLLWRQLPMIERVADDRQRRGL